MKKISAIILVIVMVFTMLAGCGESNEQTPGQTVSESGVAVNEMGNMVEDSSDLPDWTGKKLDLIMWYGMGTSAVHRNNKPTEDVVSPELFRVTGVKYSEESFDNGGELMDARIAKIMAANDWPDVIVDGENAVLEKMIEADMIYDLTDLIPKYCTNMSAIAKSGGVDLMQSNRSDGKIYTLPMGFPLKNTAPDLDRNVAARFIVPTEPNSYIYVRDDILRMIYPEAKTQQEIEDIYMTNGRFTKEEIMDVPINSKEDFFNFLYEIKKLNVKEGNRDVYPFYVYDGIDNWNLLANLGAIYGYCIPQSGANYFTYWDKESGKVDYMFKQPFFKEILRDWTMLLRDEIVSEETLVDSRAQFEEKVNNGLYAILYGTALPEQNALNTNLENAGKDYKYRKVYLNIPINNEKFLFTDNEVASGSFAIVKNTVKEEDLPQILRFVDFAFSEAGQKLTHWGPRSAGLWKEENGKRIFTDKELEANLVYDEANDKGIYYGIGNIWPGYPRVANSRFIPKLIYDFQLNPSMVNRFFSMGTVEEAELVRANAPNIWAFDGYGVEGVQKFWQSRQAFEDALLRIYVSENDAEFEKFYSDMIKVAEQNGLTDETLAEINKAYETSINKGYMENIK